MTSVLVSPLVPRNSMFIVVRMETGENKEFPEPASFKPPLIIDMVKFHMDCEALINTRHIMVYGKYGHLT